MSPVSLLHLLRGSRTHASAAIETDENNAEHTIASVSVPTGLVIRNNLSENQFRQFPNG